MAESLLLQILSFLLKPMLEKLLLKSYLGFRNVTMEDIKNNNYDHVGVFSFSFFERFDYKIFKARLCGLVTMMILVIVMETDMM